MSKPIFTGVKLHGIVLDVQPEDVPADRWSNGRNVYFRNGDTVRVPGIEQWSGTPLFPAEVIHYVDTGIQEWWIYASGAGVGVTDGQGNHYNITPSGWGSISAKNKILTMGDLNALPFVNHPEKGPFWWNANPASVMTKLPNWPAAWVCDVMRAHKNFLFALAVSDASGVQENQLRWSTSAPPGQVPADWVPSPTNDAGDVTFGSPGGPLIGGISVRDQFFVMKANATFSMQYIGGQYIFSVHDVFPSMGLYSANSLIEHDNLVYMLTGAGRLVRHDGNSAQNLLYGIGQDYLLQAINREWISSVFFWKGDNGNQIGVAYPTGSSRACTEGLLIEIASIGRGDGPLDMGIRDLPSVYSADQGYTDIIPQAWNNDPQAWNSDTTIWNEQATGYRPTKTVFGVGSSGLGELGRGPTLMGAPIAAYVERTGLEFGDFGSHKVLSGAFPRVSGNTGDLLYFRFAGQEQTGSAVNWGSEINYTIGTSQQLDFFQDGRLLGVSMRSASGGQWTLNGMQFLARKAGRW